MTEETHLAERAVKAQRIIADAGLFKICEGCDSIVAKRVVSCPNCHGYRFNEEADDVIAQATLLASRPQTSVTAEDLES